MKKILLVIIAVCGMLLSTYASSIGEWNYYGGYGDITDIQPAGNRVYVLSSKGLFSYQWDEGSVYTYHKMNSLSDSQIDHIAYNKATHRLLIIYDNYNIDLLGDDGKVVNLPYYYQKSLNAEKKVNSIFMHENMAYLNTAFGIIQIDMKKEEISNTYNLGMNCVSSTIHGDYMYAAMRNKGLYRCALKDNMLDKGNWTAFSTLDISDVFTVNGDLFAIDNSKIMKYTGTEWKHIHSAAYSKFAICDGVVVLTRARGLHTFDGTSLKNIAFDEQVYKVFAYDDTHHCFWGNQADNKLFAFQLTEEDEKNIIRSDINPDEGLYNVFSFLLFQNGTLYTTGGGYRAQNDEATPGCVQSVNGQQWQVYDTEVATKTGHTYVDVMCAAVNPRNTNHVFAGARTGLYEFLNGSLVEHYNIDNSELGSAVSNNKDYVLIMGMCFDKQGRLWVLNSQSDTYGLFYINANSTDRKPIPVKTNGALTDPYNNGRTLGYMADAQFDESGRLWFVNNHHFYVCFGCYDTNTGKVTLYDKFVNQDGTDNLISYVRCVAIDREQGIWIGTDGGLFYLPKENIGNTDYLTQIKVPRNDGTNFADYLLSGIDITCITVDAANRKWIGTNGNGVYLISADNMTQIHHFKSEETPLLSNNIHDIDISHKSGEVFISTDHGLCSYMSDATEVNEDNDSERVYAYPNPVEPSYNGLITVVGLSYNADVKITTTNGVLVNQGRSNGGSYTWDATDLDGRRVASGVYMVHTATADGGKGVVCKIAIVN